MSFFRRSSKRKSKEEEEEEEEVDFVVMNSDPSKFVAKVCFAHSHAPQVYTDAGGAQLVRHIAADGRITSVTVHCPPLTDPKPQTVTTAGFVTVVDGVVALQRVTQLKFSGYNLSAHIAALLPHFFPTLTIATVGFWRAGLDDMLAYSAVATLLQVPVITSVNLGENKLTESGRQMIETLVASSGKPMAKVDMF